MSNSVRGSITNRFRIVLIYLIALLATAALLLAGCSSSSKDDDGTNGDVGTASPTPVDVMPTGDEPEDDGIVDVPTPTEEIESDGEIGLDHVIVTPEETDLIVGQTGAFSASAYDAEGNAMPEAKITWEVTEELGTITKDGTLTAGTKAGVFDDGVKAIATLNGVSVETSCSVTVNPGPAESIAISEIEIVAGETLQLEVVATDEYGNPLADMEGVWTISDENAGTLTETGLFTAGEVAGAFTDVVEVEVTQEEEIHTVVASVMIVPGSLEQVVIAPNPAEIGIGMTQQFVAVGADQYGNRITDLVFEWSVENGGGTIDEGGLFTAGTDPDEYEDTVKVVAIQGDISRQVTADVTIEPDRITFISEREDGQYDIYIMNDDGSNIKRITNTFDMELMCAWSYGGRRIIYDSLGYNGGIVTMNDDGKWGQLLIEHGYDVINIYPSLSPDSTKVVFVKSANILDDPEEWEVDIFAMDIDGGNLTQLTDTPGASEWFPSWSPDGKKVLYVHAPEHGDQNIYVMNADGSLPKQLSMSAGTDMSPVWSPDGSKIAFMSYRLGYYDIYTMDANGRNERRVTYGAQIQDTDPAWSPDGSKIVFVSNRDVPTAERDECECADIYIVDAKGGDVTRLTYDSAKLGSPRWAPRKRGLEIDHSSVIVPKVSLPEPSKTVQQITAEAQEAVVKIESDLGSGSGFIIDSTGLVLTNNHVIVDAEEITVYLDNGDSYEATVRNRDMILDIAVLEIEAEELPYLQLGDVGALNIGEQVVVLGYPLGTDSVSVTSGFVSSVEFDKGRGITWVKTDSAINPGNSGGPLLNLQGEVVGLVSIKMVSVAVEGIGYAISANTVEGYLPRLLAEE